MATQKPVIILGAGGHSRVVSEALSLSGKDIIGIVAPDKVPGSNCFGLLVLGNDEMLLSFLPENVLLANGIGSLSCESLRWQLASRMREKGYRFTQVIHPTSIIAGDVELEEGVQVMAGAIIQSGTRIGKNTIVNTGACIDHDCQIRSNCHLAPGVTLCGNVRVGEGTHIGAGTTVIQGISIGESCVIAAGSSVYESLASNLVLIQRKRSILCKGDGR